MPSPLYRLRSPRGSAGVLLALALLGSVLEGTTFREARAQSSPAKKDSSPRTRPKDVTLTSSVTPDRARPGESVVYKVTASLKPGWHIYTYASEQVGEGPRNTRFDFFDPAGLSISGDWSPSRAPRRKKEPAFPDLEAVEFYDEDVTWSISLKVPADATPGPHRLRCQASYQICDASRCSFPGQWTLPDVVLTVTGGQAEADAKATPPDAKVAASARGPKSKDDDPKARPRAATLSATIEPAQARPGETVRYRVTARLDPGWHIYDYAKQPPPEGPRPTEFDLFDAAGLEVVGGWTADSAPEVKQEPAFNNIPVAFFENQVTWSIDLKVPTATEPGTRIVRCQAGYQVCDASSCSPHGHWTLPDATLKVVAGDASIAAAVTPAVPVTRGASSPPSTAAASATPPTPAAAEDASVPRKAVSEVERRAEQGIIPLMITAALGGLLALVMPCVWPMVPITVNFFVKQGQAKDGKSATGLAVVYCLAIIGVFTAVGVLFSFFLSATALPRLANNPWLNFAVAGLFFAFGLSLLGLFEVRLPNFLLNASAKGESRGGLVGVMFMALTLTITSFTCTFPVVGGLIVMASAGQFFYPIIGLATFASVIALPFFLLALSPGLLSMVPKSGNWMNAVKVVGGLVEIGAAFKFLNTAELAFVTPENAWFDAQFVLTAWIALAAVCGFYLLGFFRTDHDYDEVKIGPGRMIFGTAFLGLALYLTPALFGRPPQSQVWNRLVVGLLPPDVTELYASPTVLAGETTGVNASEEKATASEPAEAEKQERRVHGVAWGFSYEAAVARAKAEGKPILIDFTGVNCPNCRLMEANVLPRPDVVKLLGQFVTVQLYTDFVPIDSINADQRQELARKNMDRLIDLTNDNTNPFYVVLSPDGKVLGTVGGYREPGVFLAFLNGALDKLKPPARVARAEAGRS